MATPTILVKRTYTKADFAPCEEPAKPRGKLRAGWVDDIIASKKVVTLCTGCHHKFKGGLERYGYRREREFPRVISKCTGCNVEVQDCTLYFHEEIYKVVRSTADERRALQKDREKRIKRGYL
jgi:hypothetical protein